MLAIAGALFGLHGLTIAGILVLVHAAVSNPLCFLFGAVGPPMGRTGDAPVQTLTLAPAGDLPAAE